MTESIKPDTTLYKITWLDSIASNSWKFLDRYYNEEPTPLITSYGVIVHEDEQTITLAADFSFFEKDYFNFNRSMRIPKGCVVNKESIPIA